MIALTQLRWGKSILASQIKTMTFLVCGLIILQAGPLHAQQWNGPDGSGNISNANTGNVGIGTANPGVALEVAQNKAIRLGNANISSGGDFVHLSSHAWHNGSAWQYDGTVGGLYQIWGQIHNWYKHDGAGTFTNMMTINASGNVGIGTTNPGAPLEIHKNQDAVVKLLSLNNPSNGSSAQATLSFHEGGTEKAKFAVNSSGATAYGGGINALQIWNFSNAPTVFATNSAERMRIAADGSVGIGTATPNSQYKLDVAGNLNASGTITGGTIQAKYQDVAEWVESSQALPAGTVVVLDHTKSNQVISSTQAYDTRVAGVISAQPGIALGESGDNKVLVATTGRVRMKVDATGSPIHIGDLLVTSDTSGAAMKSKPLNLNGVELHRPGTLIGKALEPLAKGTGEILVLLSLQ